MSDKGMKSFIDAEKVKLSEQADRIPVQITQPNPAIPFRTRRDLSLDRDALCPQTLHPRIHVIHLERQ